MPTGLILVLAVILIAMVVALGQVVRGMAGALWLLWRMVRSLFVDHCPECHDGELRLQTTLPPLPGKDGLRRCYVCRACGHEEIVEVSKIALEAEYRVQSSTYPRG